MATLRFFGVLRESAATDALAVDAPTVADALGAAAGRLGAGFASVVFPGGELDADIEILVNGRNIGLSGGLGTRLKPDDEVTLFRHGARGFPGG
jgi:molybdopterin converting factor small subunit